MSIRKFAAGTALVVGAMGAGTTASAQPLVVGGLVNIVITDVIDDVTVVVEDVNVSLGAALQLAANVCDVNVNILARQLREGGATCANTLDDATVTISQV